MLNARILSLNLTASQMYYDYSHFTDEKTKPGKRKNSEQSHIAIKRRHKVEAEWPHHRVPSRLSLPHPRLWTKPGKCLWSFSYHSLQEKLSCKASRSSWICSFCTVCLPTHSAHHLFPPPEICLLVCVFNQPWRPQGRSCTPFLLHPQLLLRSLGYTRCPAP